jgi:hypothetical protein
LQAKFDFAKAARPALVLLAGALVLFEELVVRNVAALARRIARVRFVADLEARAARLPPWAAMCLFAVPVAFLVPVKVAGLWLIGSGHVFSGVAVIVAGKLAGTAVEARVFAACRPALMTVGWFARLHDWVLGVRDRAYARVRALEAWQAAAAAETRARESLRAAGAAFRARWSEATAPDRGREGRPQA